MFNYTGIQAKIVLHQLMSGLSQGDKDFVRMKLDGFSGREIAHNLDLSEGYVRLKWNRIMRRMRARSESAQRTI